MNTALAPTLTAADRCDRCGARAYVLVRLTAGELRFCAHHARAHLDALRDRPGVQIVDETSFID